MQLAEMCLESPKNGGERKAFLSIHDCIVHAGTPTAAGGRALLPVPRRIAALASCVIDCGAVDGRPPAPRGVRAPA